MKLCERLYIGQNEAKVTDIVCNLAYRSPGTASIVTNIKPTMQQVIAYECGYNNSLTRWFMGYVQSYKQINDNTYSLFCRELSAILRNSLPLAIQHKTLIELLNIVTEITGLQFVIPAKDYAKTPAAYIVNHSTGYTLMDSLGDTYGIERFTWQQQGDGRIFVGSWNDSAWNGRDIPIPHQFVNKAQIDSAQIPMNPLLRPGVMINGQRVRNIQLHKEKMQITWMSK